MSTVRVVAVATMSALSAVAVGAAGLVALVAGVMGLSPAAAGGSGTPTPVPPDMLALYRQAAQTCPGLPYAVLAAIGTVESDNGTSSLPGVHSGTNAAGAEGPMQFLPATFAEYALPVPPEGADPPSPYDPVDAVYAAARLLCANGAAGGADIPAALYAYNHSASYVAEVLDLAARYEAVLGP